MEDKVLRILGRPSQNRILIESAKSHDEPTTPQYLVYPVKWRDVDTQYISDEPYLIDFGESFKVLQPPEDLGIPGPYRSPELILDKVADSAPTSGLLVVRCLRFGRVGSYLALMVMKMTTTLMQSSKSLESFLSRGGPSPGRLGGGYIRMKRTSRAV